MLRAIMDEYERHRIVRLYLDQAKRAFRTWVVIVIALVALILQALWHR